VNKDLYVYKDDSSEDEAVSRGRGKQRGKSAVTRSQGLVKARDYKTDGEEIKKRKSRSPLNIEI